MIETTTMTCGIIRLQTGGQVPSTANMRENKWTKMKRVKAQRRFGYQLVIGSMPLVKLIAGTGPLYITLTRIGPRTLDDDNVASAFESIRDGIADALGIDDGDKRLRWRYAQERAKPYAVRVEFSSSEISQ